MYSEGMITLGITIRRYPLCRTISINFVVVKIESPYNMLLGWPTLNAFRAIFLSYHVSFKFPTPVGIVKVTSNVRDARECYLATMQVVSLADASSAIELSIDSATTPAQETSSEFCSGHTEHRHERPRFEIGDQVEKFVLCLE